MYKTIRMLPAALLLLLLGTACTNDLADTPAETGTPLVLEHVYIGTQTKAEPYEPGFANGSTLEATLTLDGATSTGTYTYDGSTWTASTPAYWHSSTEAHALTLRTTPEPTPAMPDAFTADNWHTYDILTYTGQATPGTTDFQLEHTRAQFCVALEKGDGMTDDELAAATVTANNIGMLHTDGAHYALFDTGTEITSVVITIGNDTYSYTPKETIILTKGQCTILTLKVNKAGVSGITISGEGWKDVTATSEVVIEDLPEGIIPIHSNGRDLDIPADATALLITGTLNSVDITTINNAKDRITHLYVIATSYVWDELQMNRTSSLKSVYLAHATNIKVAAFEKCTSLTSISLPNANAIGGQAFYNCNQLTSINLPNANSIDIQAFEQCTSLTSISLPNATTINTMAFRECTKLTSIDLPNTSSIGAQAFYNCNQLTSISLPKAATIDLQAFEQCTSLTTISLSKNAKDNIGDDAFYGCDLLTTLNLLDLTAEEFKADQDAYTSFGDHEWQHIYYNGGEWHRDANN